MQLFFTRSNNSINKNWPGCVANHRRVLPSNRLGSIVSTTSKRTYLIRRRKLIWKCPLKPVVSAKKSLNFKMLISPMIRDRFCSSLIYWFKTKIGLELWEIMVLESQPCSTSLLGNFNRLLGRSLSEKRYGLPTSRSRSKAWMKVSEWSTFCRK